MVDGGIATGASVRAALKALRRRKPKALVLAVPVAPADTVEALRAEVDQLICLATPEPFYAIGLHYLDFRQLSEREVVSSLAAPESKAAAKADEREAVKAATPVPSGEEQQHSVFRRGSAAASCSAYGPFAGGRAARS